VGRTLKLLAPLPGESGVEVNILVRMLLFSTVAGWLFGPMIVGLLRALGDLHWVVPGLAGWLASLVAGAAMTLASLVAGEIVREIVQ